MAYENPLESLDRDDMEWLNTIESLISLPEKGSIFSSLAKAIGQLVHSDHFAVIRFPRGEKIGTILYSSNSSEVDSTRLVLAECEDYRELSLNADPICAQYIHDSAVLREIGGLFGMMNPKTAVLCPASEGQDGGLFVLSFVRENVEFSEQDLRTLDRVISLSRLVLNRANISKIAAPAPEPEKVDEEPDIEMIGSCDAMKRLFSALRRFATTDAPILITGESGTGKEIAAQTIHERSSRANKPFVPINCGAIPEALLESELFGHERGAFTGAYAQKKGKFELADGGTLFLDEVGELPLPLQVKILRFLEDLRFERVGGTRLMRVDVRVIAATNKDLAQAVSNREFREDLYYRLAVLAIELPPLREREDDVLIMARSFLNRYAEESKREIRGFTPAAITAIRNHTWGGNVRELINRIRRAVVMADQAWIEPVDLGFVGTYSDMSALSLTAARGRLEKELIQKAIIRTEGNIAKAARELDISRPHLYQLMKKHEITKK
jgi:transcriptional regulator with GAF, ATPase, and Fis domain